MKPPSVDMPAGAPEGLDFNLESDILPGPIFGGAGHRS